MLRTVSFLLRETKPCRMTSARLVSSQPPLPPDEKDRFASYDKRTIYGEEYPIWHKPMTERPEEFRSKFEIFNIEKFNFTRMDPVDENKSWLEIFRNWHKNQIEDLEIEDQSYNSKRQHALGYDLAAAHFVCYRGGSVRFVNDTKWIKKVRGKFGFEVELPPNHVPGMYIEAIDCENFMNGGVRYEGLDNIVGLDYLKWLSFKNCPRFDNWSIDKISNLTNKTLEYLDIRGTKATYSGLYALYRFENLKFLLVDFKFDNEYDEKMAEQTYALLQEYHEDLLIKTN